MSTARFVNHEEVVSLAREMFSIDKTLVQETLSDQEIETIIGPWEELVRKGLMKVSMVFDETDSPIAMYTAKLYPKIKGWWVGATKIKQPNVHFNTSAKIMAPALDLMTTELERIGYYKVWMGAPEKHHNIRNLIMLKYSKMLPRYDWFDEYVIPEGQRSDVDIWEGNRKTCSWSDIVIRLFVLKQEYRIEYLQKQNHKDYHGTLNTLEELRKKL